MTRTKNTTKNLWLACCSVATLGLASHAWAFDDPYGNYPQGSYIEAAAGGGGRLVTPVMYWVRVSETSFSRRSARADDWLCALTRISGNFSSDVDGQVIAGLYRSDGNWGLWTSGQSWVSAQARCVPYKGFVGYDPAALALSSVSTFNIDNGNDWRWLWPDSTISVLSRVSGAFDGGGEWAGIWPGSRPYGAPWTNVSFFVQRHAQGDAAFNVNYAEGTSFYLGGDPGKRYWAGRTRWSQGEGAKRLVPVQDGFCFLAAMGGKFRGGAEKVEVVNSGGYWWLQGSSRQEAVWADAECVSYQWQW